MRRPSWRPAKFLNNQSLDLVNIEQQEADIVPFGVDFKNPDFANVAEAEKLLLNGKACPS